MSLSRQQLTLLGIFALFMGPVLLVMMMRSSWWQYQPSGMKNQGQLVQPPVHLSLEQTETESFAGKWLILYVLDQPCDKECIESVTAIRQVHRAAGRKSDHLAIVLLSELATDPELRARLEAIYPEFYFVADSSHKSLDRLETIRTGMTTDSADMRTFILDPMHNVILAYLSGADPTDLHKDLKRLLKWADQEKK